MNFFLSGIMDFKNKEEKNSTSILTSGVTLIGSLLHYNLAKNSNAAGVRTLVKTGSWSLFTVW